MARLKKTSANLAVAKARVAGLKSISPALDFGNGLTVDAYQASITTIEQLLETYNTTLSTADSQLNAIEDAEKVLRDMSERMLTGVATKYGKDSDEYEKAGGVRKRDRKKPIRTKANKTAVK
ncbi:MAG: hypothetical protein ACKO96_47305 [Flammeovirgaceae bacterium]